MNDNKLFCSQCGVELKKNDKFCYSCGLPIEDRNSNIEIKKEVEVINEKNNEIKIDDTDRVREIINDLKSKIKQEVINKKNNEKQIDDYDRIRETINKIISDLESKGEQIDNKAIIHYITKKIELLFIDGNIKKEIYFDDKMYLRFFNNQEISNDIYREHCIFYIILNFNLINENQTIYAFELFIMYCLSIISGDCIDGMILYLNLISMFSISEFYRNDDIYINGLLLLDALQKTIESNNISFYESYTNMLLNFYPSEKEIKVDFSQKKEEILADVKESLILFEEKDQYTYNLLKHDLSVLGDINNYDYEKIKHNTKKRSLNIFYYRHSRKENVSTFDFQPLTQIINNRAVVMLSYPIRTSHFCNLYYNSDDVSLLHYPVEIIADFKFFKFREYKRKKYNVGIIDSNGNIILDLIYYNIIVPNEIPNFRYAYVLDSTNWSIFDMENRNWKYNNAFDKILAITDRVEKQFVAVCKNGKWGVLDYECNFMIPCIYDYAEPSITDNIIVKQNNKYKIISKDNNVVIDNIECDDIFYGGEGFYILINKDQYVKIIDINNVEYLSYDKKIKLHNIIGPEDNRHISCITSHIDLIVNKRLCFYDIDKKYADEEIFGRYKNCSKWTGVGVITVYGEMVLKPGYHQIFLLKNHTIMEVYDYPKYYCSINGDKIFEFLNIQKIGYFGSHDLLFIKTGNNDVYFYDDNTNKIKELGEVNVDRRTDGSILIEKKDGSAIHINRNFELIKKYPKYCGGFFGQYEKNNYFINIRDRYTIYSPDDKDILNGN